MRVESYGVAEEGEVWFVKVWTLPRNGVGAGPKTLGANRHSGASPGTLFFLKRAIRAACRDKRGGLWHAEISGP